MVVCHASGRRPGTVCFLCCTAFVVLCVQGLVVGAVVYALENLTVTLHGIRLGSFGLMDGKHGGRLPVEARPNGFPFIL